MSWGLWVSLKTLEGDILNMYEDYYDNAEKAYYSPYLRNGKFTIIKWRHSGFLDYIPNHFILNNPGEESTRDMYGEWGGGEDDVIFAHKSSVGGSVLKFSSENEALNWLIKYIEACFIDEKYQESIIFNINYFLNPEFRHKKAKTCFVNVNYRI